MNSAFSSVKVALAVMWLVSVGCTTRSQRSDGYPVTDRPAFMDQNLNQSALNEASARWVEDLVTELKRLAPDFVAGDPIDAWLDRQRKEADAETAASADGSVHALEYNLNLATRILQRLKMSRERPDRKATKSVQS